ncbi:unnamed protein product [Arctia plantaginis]|uniref:DUF7041 domain-containing protein n=1 Tax=Arctia plantaginis TaxID=874455 RepID=A0A8S0YU62_ARCPL|nr:unnamed protein product [Arctia plantaginis]CAB3247998.1 unnamed protein product [Arctia plantaginis]
MDYLPFPCFSSEKLAIWFAQVESVFALNGVTTDTDKYDYVVAHTPTEFTSMVEDILLNPPPQSKYDHIKYEFIKRMSIFHLKREKLSQEKPSEYLRRLIKMADQRVPIEVVLNTWLKNLPKPVREVVSLETSGHVETIGPMADKVMALLPSTELQKNTSLSSEQFETIVKRIDELAKQVQIVQLMLDEDLAFEEQQMIKKQERVSGTENKNDEEKGTVKNKRSSQNALCWYHTVFGERAVACIAPCQYNTSPSLRH